MSDLNKQSFLDENGLKRVVDKFKEMSSSSGSSGIGQSMDGQTVKPTSAMEEVANRGSEIFNDYRQRVYTSTTPTEGNIASGMFSHAEGCTTTAQGGFSHAEGYNTTASGDFGSHAEGYNTTASAACAHAEGEGSVASGSDSHAEGHATKAQINNAHAEGERTTASGMGSHAEGTGSTASGAYSHAEGYGTKAEANCAHSEGEGTQALGLYSHAGGYYTIARYCGYAIGQFNVDSGAYNEQVTPNYLTVGNGTAETARANIFRVAHDGVYGTSAFKATGADYAEMFEWEDGNPNNEDRVGRFVTLRGEKIALSGPDDEFILGVISGNPTIVGNDHEDQWCKMFITDIFGRPVYEDIDIPESADENGIVTPAHTERRQKLNPDYNNEERYIGRQYRPEWDAVGFIGKLVMIDDGTCQVDGYCKPTFNGIATHSDILTKYRVISRLDETHIRVLLIP